MTSAVDDLTEAEVQDVWLAIRRAMRELMGEVFGARLDFSRGIVVGNDLRVLIERRALKAMGYPPPYWTPFEPPASTLNVIAEWLPRGCVG